MAELQYKLMTSAVNNFDCGNSAINEYVENSYFCHTAATVLCI